jgi:hypothetical protein
VKQLFACDRPLGASPTGEAESSAGATYTTWRTETREYLRIERGNSERWFRQEVVHGAR